MNFVVSSAPHIRSPRTTKHIMLDVLIALLPAAVAGVVYFGWVAFVTILLAMFTAALTEFCWYIVEHKIWRSGKETVTAFFRQFDHTSLVTGLLLALVCPASLEALYMPVLGAVFAIAVVKMLFGGTGSESFRLDMPAFYPDRLECGTLSYPAVCSLFEGALLVKERRGMWAKKLIALTQAAAEGIAKIRGFRVYSSPDPCGICAFAHTRIPSEELSDLLSERYNIAVRGGLHCAPLAHKALQTFPAGLVRASFSPEQGMREVHALLSALRAVAKTATSF